MNLFPPTFLGVFSLVDTTCKTQLPKAFREHKIGICTMFSSLNLWLLRRTRVLGSWT